MAESSAMLQNTATTGSTVITEQLQPTQSTQSVTLKLRKPKSTKKIQWSEETVDNEGMGKKKSKCCCIYNKPKLFGESSDEESDDGDETDHCRGHKGKCYHQSGGQDSGNPDNKQ